MRIRRYFIAEFETPEEAKRRESQLLLAIVLVAIAGVLIPLLVLCHEWPMPCASHDGAIFCDKDMKITAEGLPGTTIDQPADPRNGVIQWLDAAHGDSDTLLKSPGAKEGEPASPDAHEHPTLTTRFQLASGELRWFATFLILVLASIGAFQITLFNGYRLHRWTQGVVTRTLLIFQFGVCCLCPFTTYLYYVGRPDKVPWGMQFVSTLSQHLSGVEQHLTPLIAFSDGIFLSVLISWGYFTLALLGARFQSPGIRFFMTAQNCVNTLAVALSVVLVASVIHARAYLTWPLGNEGTCSASDLTATTRAYCGLVDSEVFMYGAISTLIFGMMIAASTLIVTRRLYQTALDACPDNPAKWVSDRSLGVSSTAITVRFLSAAAPLFAGIIGSILDKVAG